MKERADTFQCSSDDMAIWTAFGSKYSLKLLLVTGLSLYFKFPATCLAN